MELEELKRDYDLKIVDYERLQHDFQESKRKYDTAVSDSQRLLMENQQMSDELELAKEKASKLVKAEAAIEKYQSKLEEMTVLRKEKIDLTKKLDEYLDQINVLESSNKSITTLQRQLEHYKDKAVELEREKFEAVTANELNKEEINKLRNELNSSRDSKRAIENELNTLRHELIDLQGSASSNQVGSSGPFSDSNDEFSMNNFIALKERVKKLEYENTSLRQGDSQGSSGDMSLLQAELDDLKRSKREK